MRISPSGNNIPRIADLAIPKADGSVKMGDGSVRIIKRSIRPFGLELYCSREAFGSNFYMRKDPFGADLYLLNYPNNIMDAIITRMGITVEG